MRTLLCSLLFFLVATLWAKPPHLTDAEVSTPPPRIIRTCCSFGSDVPVVLMPFKKVTNITSLENIGPHCYMGNQSEGNGIIYTLQSGFLDLGHMRDVADWTAYLYSLIQSVSKQGTSIDIDLGNEGGSKILTLNIPEDIDTRNAALLAGKIAYDLSLWHEIATWFGASYVPMIPERYSSFSPEDLYSNLLGVNLGIQAIESELEYDSAMTQLIAQSLDRLEAVSNENDTYIATEQVLNIWWTRDKSLPSKNILLKRYFGSDTCLIPWLLPGNENSSFPYALNIPIADKIPFSELYQLNFKMNYKFPRELLIALHGDRTINDKDFYLIVDYIERELLTPTRKIPDNINQEKVRKRRNPDSGTSRIKAT